MITLLLPGSSSEFPPGLNVTNKLVLDRATTTAQLADLGGPLESSVIQVIAGQNTPAELIKTAQRYWPNTPFYQHAGGQTWKDGWPKNKPASNANANANASQPKASPPSTTHAPSQPSLSALTFECYKLHAWGKQKQDSDIVKIQGQFELLMEDCAEPEKYWDAWNKAQREGREAHRLAGILKQKFKARRSPGEIQAWLDETCDNAPGRIKKSLEIEQKKQLKRRESNRKKGEQNAQFKPSMPELEIPPAGHPNALTQLSPSTEWIVLVDETGKHFDEQVEELQLSDKSVGKMVALILPGGLELPLLPKNFHATDEGNAAIEKVLHTLIQQPVGIFGFSSKDSTAGRFGWLQKVEQLVHWVLRLLPLEPDATTRVRVHIEQRGSYKHEVDLSAVSELLASELKDLSPDRYRNLQLSMRFIKKDDHPSNGYVDTVANCWGSPDGSRRALLNRCKLPGHCLIDPQNNATYERLLLALESQQKLRPADWFDLQQEAGDALSNPTTLVYNCFQQLGERLKAGKDQSLWQSYLDEVQQRLRQKDFQLSGLGRALDWLECYAPENQALNSYLKLQQVSARLALKNHQGHCDASMVREAIRLAEGLRDEAAPQACEAFLRVLVSATNAFDFSSCSSVLDDWLSLPVATVGTLNHAKLHSTRGQLLAFRGEYSAANESFKTAIIYFETLSDATKAKKDIQQTHTYLLFAQLCNPVQPCELPHALREHVTTALGNNVKNPFARLARSGQGDRFTQQLGLRALVELPEQFGEERQQVLDNKAEWQQGEDHPWPLILAYRAWLLKDAGHQQAAVDLINDAIDLCTDQPGITLHWMALVLMALGHNLQLIDAPTSERLALMQKELPNADHTALAELVRGTGDRAELLTLLTRCLPFNFH